MPALLPNLSVDECPDALGFSTIRVADGSPNGDTDADVIATVYLDEFAPVIAEAPAMLAALQALAAQHAMPGPTDNALHLWDEVAAILSRIDGTPTADAQPAHGSPEWRDSLGANSAERPAGF